ncbi:hypothetical protein V5O48_001904 [Marasmius crinis-equi]|uniref:Uncharacterized protein n=1 Tax=Marasmius crinis-equi TaxID=585013 RepID=A0ABR3FX81_9AGAR
MLSSKLVVLALAYFALGAPFRREVPQEHSHRKYLIAVQTLLQKNNPEKFLDPVFGLLGNAAAAQGLGTTTDATCLQQAMADRAFTNAKDAGDSEGQINALIYRALERNSVSVGGVTDACTSVKATNPEIAAIQQHQDAASPNASEVNKAIELELAKQIATLGGDPLLALESGTFAPGQIGDPTAKGNTCDDPNDDVGCIFTLNRLTPAATEDDIRAAVGGAGAGAGNGGASSSATATATDSAATDATPTTSCVSQITSIVTVTVAPTATASVDSSATCSLVTVTVTAGASATSSAAATATASVSSSAAAPTATSENTGGNLQTFTGALGGQPAPAVNPGGKGFQVEGSDEFLNVGAALGRSCDIQHNKCANVANSGGGFSVGECDQQNNECHAAIST